MLRAFVRRGFRFCNMRMERLLALINRACGSDMPDAERFVAMSLLAQMMKAHRSLGRADPVTTSRAELLQAGVPLRAGCKPAKLQRRGDCGALFAYVNQMQQERISAGFHHFTAAENYEFRRGCSERFASLRKAEQKPFADKAQHLLAQRDAAADEAKPAHVKYSDEWEKFVSSLGSDKYPLSLDNFRMHISLALGLDVEEDKSIHGMDSYASVFRRQAADAAFVEDVADIQSDEEFAYDVPCSIVHPGFCASSDSEVLELASLAVRGLQRCLAKRPVGSYHMLTIRYTSSITSTIIRLSHKRGGNPKVTLMTRCRSAGCGISEDGCCVAIEEMIQVPCAIISRRASLLLSSRTSLR